MPKEQNADIAGQQRDTARRLDQPPAVVDGLQTTHMTKASRVTCNGAEELDRVDDLRAPLASNDLHTQAGQPYTAVERETTGGREWDGKSPALLATQMRWTPERPHSQLEVDVIGHFQPTEIPQGSFVQTTIYVGCTGATFELEILEGDAVFEAYTGEIPRTAEREVTASLTRGVRVAPSIKLESSAATHGIEGGSVNREAVSRSKTKFTSHADARLTHQCYDGKRIRWTYDRERVVSEVRDYLEEKLELQARVRMRGNTPVRIESTSRAKDRLVFGPDRRRLDGLAAYAVYLRLLTANAKMPKAGPITHKVLFERSVAP